MAEYRRDQELAYTADYFWLEPRVFGAAGEFTPRFCALVTVERHRASRHLSTER
jgi:hypothetical protein